MALTEQEWITLLLRLSPPDLKIIHDLALSFDTREKTGETAALHSAWIAFMARLKEKERIANN
jgi:hypothetical protein